LVSWLKNENHSGKISKFVNVENSLINMAKRGGYDDIKAVAKKYCLDDADAALLAQYLLNSYTPINSGFDMIDMPAAKRICVTGIIKKSTICSAMKSLNLRGEVRKVRKQGTVTDLINKYESCEFGILLYRLNNNKQIEYLIVQEKK